MPNQLAKLVILPGEKTNLLRLELHRGKGKVIEMPSRMHVAKRDDPAPTTHSDLIVEPGKKVKLGEIDPAGNGHSEGRESSLTRIESLSAQLDRLQYLMYAEKKHALLIVFQGLDASGKDGAIRHLLQTMNPIGCHLVGFKQPKPEELDHDFLWRVHPHLPAKGEISIFNRSHYEDVLVVRVHRAVPAEFWFKRYELINSFEKLIAVENNTTILKFFLHISKDEQLERFRQRLDDPARQWKISEADYHERAYWDDYVTAFEDMLNSTSTRYAPWFVVPANEKWFRDLVISEIVARTLEDLNMKWPEPSVDITEIRRRYHAAEVEDGAC